MPMLRRSIVCIALVLGGAADGSEPPSRPGVDAPELARLGRYAVGLRTLTLVDRNQVDASVPPIAGVAARRDRPLVVDLWYPARATQGAVPETYHASMPPEQPGAAAAFTIQGLAVRDAPPDGRGHALVVVSHGRRNADVALSWLTENLASKGYVVAAIRHDDPAVLDAFGTYAGFLYRPLDIAFVTRTLQRTLADEGLVDPTRTALIGYSMGGFGVLTSAGATVDPDGPARGLLNGLLLPYARGGAAGAEVLVGHLRAVIAIAPGPEALMGWGADGIAALRAPLLLIAGDRDRTVAYDKGARAFFEGASGSHRYLLTFLGAGHAIGLDPAPDEMRRALWNLEWFEDPVWRKDRIIAINLHIITAFLDRFVLDDESRAPYLQVPVPRSSDGQWPSTTPVPDAELSPANNGITVWKGFPRLHAEGLELLERQPAPTQR